MRRGFPFLRFLVLPCFAAGWAQALDLAPVDLIPRRVLFGNPDRLFPQISPDGSKLAFLAPHEGRMNVWVGPLDDPKAARPVTRDTVRGIRQFYWAHTNQHVLYLQDEAGDENWRVHLTDVSTTETRDLTPFKGVAARMQEISPNFPDTIVIALNKRDSKLHDLYRLNLADGRLTLLAENPAEHGFVSFVTDADFEVRYAVRITKTGGEDVYIPKDGGWELHVSIAMEDAMSTEPVGFDKSGQVLYMKDSRGRDTSALRAFDLKTGESKVLAADDRADVSGVLVHPTEKTVQAVAFEFDRRRWQFLSPEIERDFERLRSVARGDISIVSRSLDDCQWIVAYDLDNAPAAYYRYERSSGKAQFLFSNRSKLEGLPLAGMRPVVIQSRDGLDLVCYLSLPPESIASPDSPQPKSALPMVLLVHGGPWARDGWGLHPQHQWLANRGYAVMSVNFRGSTGVGKKFVNAGNGEWAGKMHDDLLDAVKWAVKQKIADEKRIAIMGGSYGGYATLVGLTFTPETFTCGVDIVGPSNLVTLLESIPPYWAPMLESFVKRVGDHRTPEGRKLLLARSPLTHVDRIRRPLLIGQGANDPRVKQSESDQIVKAMQDRNISVTYVLYPDEGHGFQRPENRLSFYAVTEAFLAQHLGGRSEPFGEDFAGSSLRVPAGVDAIPGLAGRLR